MKYCNNYHLSITQYFNPLVPVPLVPVPLVPVPLVPVPLVPVPLVPVLYLIVKHHYL